MTRLRLLLVALALLPSSNSWADLKTYDVDPQYQQEILTALQRVLDSQGRVQLLPTGQIVVNAAPETLQQVDQVMQTLGTQRAPAAPRVSLRYWGVLGTRAPDANSIGSPAPAVLNDVLGELERLHGELAFRVIGTAAVATNSGQRGDVRGTTLSVEQTAYVQGDRLNAEIAMALAVPRRQVVAVVGAPPPSFDVGSLTLRTTLQRGEFVVLGESHVQVDELEGPVFYIVHWEE